jgi:hypothetical protein
VFVFGERAASRLKIVWFDRNACACSTNDFTSRGSHCRQRRAARVLHIDATALATTARRR